MPVFPLRILPALVGALLDLVAPASCVVCGCPPGSVEFCGRGPRVKGLRAWDEPSLCADCAGAQGPAVTARLADGDLIVWAAGATGPDIARIIHAWKYHGQRGLAWPLAERLGAVAGPPPTAAAPLLVPVPLHRRRRRRRGFNQAELLARLWGRRRGLAVRADLLRRRLATGQQARLADGPERFANVAGAFAAPCAPPAAPPLLLVDDVVTSGATVLAAAGAARRAGWPVAGVVCVATSLPPVKVG